MTSTEHKAGAGYGRGWRPGRLRPVRTHQPDGTLSPELLTSAGIFRRNQLDLNAGALLLAAASVLLAADAAAMGLVSWHAQYAFVFGAKHQHLASALEATGLDASAVIFSVLGIALARLGRHAAIERVLVVACAAGSCAMNLLGANLGSPRSIAVYAMPPVLFACGSDRLIAVIRRAALGPAEDMESQRSAWRIAGAAVLYLLRFALAPPSTVTGARRAVLNATPLPVLAAAPVTAPELPAIEPAPGLPAIEPVRMAECPACRREVPVLVGQLALHACGAPGPEPEPGDLGGDRGDAQDDERQDGGDDPGAGPRRRGPRAGTKTAQFLGLVADQYGPAPGIDPGAVYRICAELAPKVGLHEGSARTALRAAVLAAQAGGDR